MGDSDDEYDRKRRDKFRGERTEYRGGEGRREERRGGMGGAVARDEWPESAPPPRKMDKGYPEYDPYEAKRLKERANSFQSYQGTRSSESWGGGGGGRNRMATSYPDYRQTSGPPGRSNSGNGSRDRYSPPSRSHEMSQPIKRSRTDWGEERRYMPEPSYSGGGGYVNNPWGPPESHYGHPPGPYGTHGGPSRDADVGQTQPAMMSFKSFLQTQDDNISDEEAINKYNEYKLEFKRQQLNDFFVNHKDEEWFKIKYHPEDSVKRKDEQMSALKNRVSVFLEFLEKDRFASVTVDADQSEALVKLLDCVVIKLEGGTEFDLEILEQVVTQVQQQSEPPPRTKELVASSKQDEGSFTPPPRGLPTEESGAEPVESKTESLESPTEPQEQDKDEELKEEVAEEKKQDVEMEEERPKSAAEMIEAPIKTQGKKRKREYDFESGSDSADDLDDEPRRAEEPLEPLPPGDEIEEGKDADPIENGSTSATEHKDSEDEGEELVKSECNDKQREEGDEESKEDTKEEEKTSEKSPEEEPHKEEKVEEPEEPKPRALHRTASIFLRNLAPTITKQEVEAMCKRYPGFLRVAIADPQPERRWFRRGWVTFERDVNIKEICWNLNNIRLRDCELGAIVNRDLSRRVRTVNGITSHKQVVRQDIKVAARIVQNLDEKMGLWDEPGQSSAQSDIPSFGLVSKNPVLKNITDYLIEEASAEEEELLGQASSSDPVLAEGSEAGDPANQSNGSTVERDDTLLRVLDKLLFYLRIVHSVDYYNHCEYPNEDEMPNRCGIMHARGIPPSSKVTQQEITDYCTTFEQKIASFLQPATKLSMEDLQKLGAKDPEAEVEKFVIANTQELAKDKWLCPLSGKKFKGPDFVRKHIFNKHGEKVDEVKKEVEYFNNYLRDPKRPQLPEHPGNRSQKREVPGERDGYSSGGGPGYMPPYGGGYNNYGVGAGGMNSRGYNNYTSGYGGGPSFNREPYHREPYSRPHRGGHYGNRGNRGGDYRPVIHYRDLDAPREPEEF